MGLSFHDQTSLVEAVGSLHISQDNNLSNGPHDPNVIPELETISIGEERRDDGIGGSDDIQMIDR